MNLHADARGLIAHWAPPDAVQERLREQYLRHLDANPDAMWRSCAPDHLTASALVVDPANGHVLLTLHRRLHRWLQTGGHCESGDVTLAAAARREAAEESGMSQLDIDPQPVLLSRHQVPCGPLRPAHHLDVQFVAVAPAGASPVCSAESDDVAWFDPHQLPEATDESVRALVRRALERLGL